MYGFVQPYKSLGANILEMIVQINFLVLLLLRGTEHIQELYLVFPEDSSSSSAGDDGCSDGPNGIAELTWLLMPFYYVVPFAVFGAAAVVYVALYLR